MIEEYKKIDEVFEISNYGNLKVNGIITPPSKMKTNELFYNIKGRVILIKSLVATYFLDKKDKHSVKKIIDDKNNNRVDNLFLYDNELDMCVDDSNLENLKFRKNFSFKMQNVIKVDGKHILIYQHISNILKPYFDIYLNENEFILGRHLKPTVKFDKTERKYNKTLEKEDEKFNIFLNSLKENINKIANELGYLEVKEDKSFIYIWKDVLNNIAKMYKQNEQVISKLKFIELKGFDLFPELKNNAYVYIFENKIGYERKLKIKNLLN